MKNMITKTHETITKPYSLTHIYKLSKDLHCFNQFDRINPCNFAT